jgi:hypothetical protein
LQSRNLSILNAEDEECFKSFLTNKKKGQTIYSSRTIRKWKKKYDCLIYLTRFCSVNEGRSAYRFMINIKDMNCNRFDDIGLVTQDKHFLFNDTISEYRRKLDATDEEVIGNFEK